MIFPVNDHESALHEERSRPRYACVRCNGLGWLPPEVPGVTWPLVCGLCKGRASFSTFALGKMLNEAPSTIERLDLLRVRPTTASRLLTKLIDLAR